MDNMIPFLLGLFAVFTGITANIPINPAMKRGGKNNNVAPSPVIGDTISKNVKLPTPVHGDLLSADKKSSSLSAKSGTIINTDLKTAEKQLIFHPRPAKKRTSNTNRARNARRSRRRRRRRRPTKKTTNPSKASKPKTKSIGNSPSIAFEPKPSKKPKSTASSPGTPKEASVAKSTSKSTLAKSPSVIATQMNTNSPSSPKFVPSSDSQPAANQMVSASVISRKTTDLSSLPRSASASLPSSVSSFLNQQNMFAAQNEMPLMRLIGPLAKLMMMSEQRREAQAEMLPFQRMMINRRMPSSSMMQPQLVDGGLMGMQMPVDMLVEHTQRQPNNAPTPEITEKTPSAVNLFGMESKGIQSPFAHLQRLQEPITGNPMLDMLLGGKTSSSSKQSQMVPSVLNNMENPSTKAKAINKQTKEKPLLQDQGLMSTGMQMEAMPMQPMARGLFPMESMPFGQMPFGPFNGLLTRGSPGVPNQNTNLGKSAKPLTGQSTKNNATSSLTANIMNSMQQRYQRYLCLRETPMVIQTACSLTQQPTTAKPKCHLNMKCVELTPGVGTCCANSKQHASILEDWVEFNFPERFHR